MSDAFERAQAHIVGLLLGSPRFAPAVLACPGLEWGFTHPSIGRAFRLARERLVAEAPVDALWLSDHSEGALTPDQVRFWVEEARGLTEEECESQIQWVHHKGQTTYVRTQALTLAQLAAEGAQVARLRQQAEVLFPEGADQGSSISLKGAVEAALTAMVAHVEHGGGLVGLSSGLPLLDDLLGGFRGGQLIVLAARPAMGKTALALNWAHAMAQGGHPVSVVSLEMPSDELAKRWLCLHSGVSSQALRHGRVPPEGWAALAHAQEVLSALPVSLVDGTRMSLEALRVKAKEQVAKGCLKALIIDYLQLMDASGHRDRQSEVSALSRGLKKLARELDIPVIVLSQLNRELERRSEKRPTLSDLRESGAIEQDADVIVFIYRDEVYTPDTEDKGVAELIVAKQRSGPTGTVRVRFDGATTRFSP
jgi:replicative DNA helicase